ncbi:hypothetical protein ACS0TY_026287 [Phlomoides rotata]
MSRHNIHVSEPNEPAREGRYWGYQEVLKLVKLRYLALTYNGTLPPSISDLRKLQYLIAHPHLSIKSCGDLFNLPMEIWDMKQLKHLQWSPESKEVGIKIELAPDAADPLYCFDHISHLTNLESLKCVIVNPAFKLGVVSPVLSFPCFSFSLKKLSLSGMGYPWKEMRNIASLPNLGVLKLRFNAFRGPEWELEENGFPNLRVLLIEDIDLVKLKWAHENFKTLFVLRIKHCYKLEELHLENLPKIIEVEVVDCSPLTEWYSIYWCVLHGNYELHLDVKLTFYFVYLCNRGVLFSLIVDFVPEIN